MTQSDESILASRDVLRPAHGFKPWLMGKAMAALPLVFRIVRSVWPIPKFRTMVAATRCHDVREVFLNDEAFGVPYKPKLDVIMGDQPFFLGMGDTPAYRAGTEAMRKVMRREDVEARLAPAVEKQAGEIVEAAGGKIEVVDQLVRQVTFDFLGEYFGVPKPPNGDLRVWATRLFEFQFADQGNDPALRKEVDVIAPALRAHIQNQIETRRASGAFGNGPDDDVLGRCLFMQAKGESGFSDDQIRTALMGFIVGGPPQPPMVVPQAMEQLLRRPGALAGAQAAARSGDDDLLSGYVFEAMRFDPLAPALPRIALADCDIAGGTHRERKVKKGANVYAAIQSAMLDPTCVPDPQKVDPRRPWEQYMHFGHGLHTCFGIHINRGTLHLMLKPLLARKGLRRASGEAGHLSKIGAFAHELHVCWD
jgi:cytochrome P450